MKHIFIPLIVQLSLVLLTGCSGMMFFPGKQHYFTPAAYDLNYDDVYLDTQDGERIHGWHVKAVESPPKGAVLFLHGNAENISTHFTNVAWLPYNGYDVFALDYRGYGLSSGSPDIQGALQDINQAHQWLSHSQPFKNQPLFLLGQSIGGALALSHAGSLAPEVKQYDGIIIDAGFPSFTGIAEEKLSESWLTWLIHPLTSLLITSDYDPEHTIKRISPTPLLFFHSTIDRVVPFHHGQSLYDQAETPKQILKTKTSHTATFQHAEHRKQAIEFLEVHRLQETTK